MLKTCIDANHERPEKKGLALVEFKAGPLQSANFNESFFCQAGSSSF